MSTIALQALALVRASTGWSCMEASTQEAVEAALSGSAQLEPLDTPLPCDVKVGGGVFRKGVPLSTFVMAARHWHREAFPDGYTLTDEQKAENLARLQGLAASPAEPTPLFGWPEGHDDRAPPAPPPQEPLAKCEKAPECPCFDKQGAQLTPCFLALTDAGRALPPGRCDLFAAPPDLTALLREARWALGGVLSTSGGTIAHEKSAEEASNVRALIARIDAMLPRSEKGQG